MRVDREPTARTVVGCRVTLRRLHGKRGTERFLCYRSPVRWRTFLIDWSTKIVDGAWLGYWTIVAALAILCYVNVALWVLAYLLGIPLP